MAEMFVKNCKKCSFSAPKIKKNLGLHIENDHQYEVQCSDCNNKLHLKNRVKKAQKGSSLQWKFITKERL